MNATKNGNVLTITLDENEDKAIDRMITTRGMKAVLNGLQAWLDTRRATAEAEEKREVYQIFRELPENERRSFREKRKGAKSE
jgi:hypothetical protein